MSKMAEMDQTIKELRDAAAAINSAADWLYQQFSGTDEGPAPQPEETQAEPEPKKELKLEDVRKVLAERSRAGYTAQIRELQKELIRKANSKQDYDAIADEIFRLREQKSQAEADTRSREETQKRIAELQDFIGSQQSEITEFDESLVRKLIQQITVYDGHLAVRFKSGLEININE